MFGSAYPARVAARVHVQRPQMAPTGAAHDKARAAPFRRTQGPGFGLSGSEGMALRYS
jgi:hypothetical protein